MRNYEQLQYPDMLGAYLQGRQGAEMIQEQNFAQQQRPLQLEQLRMALQTTQMRQQEAQQYMGEQGGQDQSSAPPPPPGSPVAQPGEDMLTAIASDRRIASMVRHDQFEAALKGGSVLDPVKKGYEVQDAALKDQQARAKFNLQPQIDQIETIRTADHPAQLVMANPSYQKILQSFLQAKGLNPNDPANFTDDNVREAAAFTHNNIAANSHGAIAPIDMPSHLETVGKKGGYQYNVDPISGKTSEIPGQTTPYQRAQLGMEQERLNITKKASEGFSGKPGLLLAAMADAGVPLPSGMRSKEQQLGTLNGLIERHPEMTMDEIAQGLRDGKINMAADTRQASVAGGIAGKVSYAENELESSIPLARTASANVPRGKFMPLNKLMQMANTSISDPDLLDLKIKTQSVLNAYDMLAARGGTDVGKREQQHSLLMSAQSPEAYERALKAFTQEAQVARRAGESASHVGATGVGGGPSAKTVTQAQVADYAQKHGLTVDAAMKHVQSNGYVVK